MVLLNPPRICAVEPFLYEATPQEMAEEGASSNQLNEQALEDYLNRLREAACEDIQCIIDECCDGGGGGGSFLSLSDTPNSYAGQGLRALRVNGAEDAIEFFTLSTSALPNLVDNVEVSSGRQVDGNNTFFKLRDVGTLPNNSTTTTAHNIGAAFALVQAYGVANDPTAPNGLPLVFATTSFATNTVYFFTDATNINVVTGTDRTSYTNNYVVLEYYYL